MYRRRANDCRVLLVCVLLAGCGADGDGSGAFSDFLRYKLQAGDEFGYQVTIKTKSSEGTETFQGTILYEVQAADTDKLVLWFSGGLRITSNIDYGPTDRPRSLIPGSATQTITLDRRGVPVSRQGLTSMPYVLGQLETFVFEELPEEASTSWTTDRDLTVISSRNSLFPGRIVPFGHSPTSDAAEHIEYELDDADGAIAQYEKTYQLTTAPEQGGVGELTMTGEGSFTLNRARGLIESATMQYEFTNRDRDETHTAVIDVNYQLLSPEQVAIELQPIKNARLMETERQLAQSQVADPSPADMLPPPLAVQPPPASAEPPDPRFAGLQGEALILAKLGSGDSAIIRQTFDELWKEFSAERSPEIARAIAALLNSADLEIQRKAADALIRRGTIDVEAELLAACKSDDIWVSRNAQLALDEIHRLTPSSPAAPPAARTWSSASGEFQLEAAFVAVHEQVVTLRKADGTEVEVPLEKLSEADRLFVEQQTSPPPTAAASASPVALAAPDAGTSVDLLAEIDLQRDQVAGEWAQEGGQLIAPEIAAARLVIQRSVPQRYRLTFVVERLTGKGSLNLGLIIGGRQTMLLLEGWGSATSGLHLLDNGPAANNETTFRSPVFAAGKPSTIVCTVRESSVQVSCNGQQVLDWSGQPERLSMEGGFWSNLPPDKLFLGSWGSKFQFSRIELEALAE